MAKTFQPLRIGGITVEFPVILAALAGYSDLPYRLICRSLGFSYGITEAMLDRLLLVEGRLRNRLVQLDPADHPVAGQIMGTEPAVMAEAARALDAMGFDVIDLNFACPVKKVVSHKRGGALMNDPGRALAIVRAVVAAVPGRPVTLKLRRSFRENDRTHETLSAIARGAFEAGAAAVCVHARSVEQKYSGRANWEFLARLKRELGDRTIIGSGDVADAAAALRMIEETGVDGVAAARGAIGNPWFSRQARDIAAGRPPHRPSLEEQRQVLLRHFGLAGQVYGTDRALKKIVHIGLHYARMHPHPAVVRKALLEVRTEENWRAVLESHYLPGLS